MGIYRKKQKPLRRHSRAGGNLGLSVRKLIGKNGFFRFYVLDSHFRGNDVVQVSVRMDSSFPHRRESRSVGAETYRVKRFLKILRLGFPLLWE
ncbi:putative pilS cassette [Neisseria meningitidis NM151]|nr:putative pilS cassette [Neisseria meningitidis NM151]